MKGFKGGPIKEDRFRDNCRSIGINVCNVYLDSIYSRRTINYAGGIINNRRCHAETLHSLAPRRDENSFLQEGRKGGEEGERSLRMTRVRIYIYIYKYACAGKGNKKKRRRNRSGYLLRCSAPYRCSSGMLWENRIPREMKPRCFFCKLEKRMRSSLSGHSSFVDPLLRHTRAQFRQIYAQFYILSHGQWSVVENFRNSPTLFFPYNTFRNCQRKLRSYERSKIVLNLIGIFPERERKIFSFRMYSDRIMMDQSRSTTITARWTRRNTTEINRSISPFAAPKDFNSIEPWGTWRNVYSQSINLNLIALHLSRRSIALIDIVRAKNPGSCDLIKSKKRNIESLTQRNSTSRRIFMPDVKTDHLYISRLRRHNGGDVSSLTRHCAFRIVSSWNSPLNPHFYSEILTSHEYSDGCSFRLKNHTSVASNLTRKNIQKFLNKEKKNNNNVRFRFVKLIFLKFYLLFLTPHIFNRLFD